MAADDSQNNETKDSEFPSTIAVITHGLGDPQKHAILKSICKKNKCVIKFGTQSKDLSDHERVLYYKKFCFNTKPDMVIAMSSGGTIVSAITNPNYTKPTNTDNDKNDNKENKNDHDDANTSDIDSKQDTASNTNKSPSNTDSSDRNNIKENEWNNYVWNGPIWMISERNLKPMRDYGYNIPVLFSHGTNDDIQRVRYLVKSFYRSKLIPFDGDHYARSLFGIVSVTESDNSNNNGSDSINHDKKDRKSNLSHCDTVVDCIRQCWKLRLLEKQVKNKNQSVLSPQELIQKQFLQKLKQKQKEIN